METKDDESSFSKPFLTGNLKGNVKAEKQEFNENDICSRLTVSKRCHVLFSQRWILAYLFFWGFFFTYALRVNLSVAIVCMTKTPIENNSLLLDSDNITVSHREECGSLDQEIRSNERAEFDWNKSQKSSLLSSFFYGYLLTQILGGWLSDRFGGRRVYGYALAVSGIATLLTPICARTNIILVYVMRIICGLATGTCFPAAQSMWGRWAPRMERTKLVSTGQVGAYIGTVATFAGSGFLCDYGFDNGWGSIFYIIGGLTMMWVVIWFYQVRDTPNEHPRITDDERNHIINNVEYNADKRTSKVPWRDMIKSKPLWAIIAAHTFGNWGTYTLLTSLPEFMKTVLKFDIKSNGAMSAVPYLCSAFIALSSAQLADCLRSRKILTTTQTRRLFQGIAHIGSAVFLVAAGFVTCENRYLAVVFLCVSLCCVGFTRGGYAVNHIDIAPKYGGILFGITNTCATIPGMIAPVTASALTPNDTPEEWRNVFYVTAAFYVGGATIFTCFARGEIQYWALDDKDLEEHVEKMVKISDDKKELN